MSDKPKKKLTLKERMALKKKKLSTKAFRPKPETEAQREQRLQREEQRRLLQEKQERLALEKEPFDNELQRTYDMYKERYGKLAAELQTFDVNNLATEDEQYEYMFVYSMMEAMKQVPAERWDKYKQHFSEEDLQSIAHSYKLYNKYMMMKEVQQKVQSGMIDSYMKYKKDYADFIDMLDKILGFKTDDPFVDIQKQFEEAKRRQKQKQKQELIDEKELKFKKIEWQPELVLSIPEILRENEKKQLGVFDASREPLVTIFIGHVDSGKSTISGQILYRAGQVSELEIQKLKNEAKALGRESWWAAYIMDINKEERDKGKTVDMGRATFSTESKRFTIMDCPGHKNYVQNMISGAAQADVAVLVVSARTGEFEAGFERTGQTTEHAMLARALGAQRMVVLVNKMDTQDWSQQRYETIKEKITPYLVKNCGFLPENLYWTAIEGLTGENIIEPVRKPEAAWFKGPTLFQVLDGLPRIPRSKKQMLRIPVLSKVNLSGDVIEVFGKVESGILKPGMELTIMPRQYKLKVTEIQNELDQKMAFAGPGESIKMCVKDIEYDAISRGAVICGSQFWTNVSTDFVAEVTMLELPQKMLVCSGFTFVLHIHTEMVETEILKVLKVISKGQDDGEEVHSHGRQFLRSQWKAQVVVRTMRPICLEKYEEFADLGRFAMRKDTFTVGTGRVLKFKPVNKDLLKNNYYFKKKANA